MLIYLDLQLYLASFKRDLAIEITNSPIINSQVNWLKAVQSPLEHEVHGCVIIIFTKNMYVGVNIFMKIIFAIKFPLEVYEFMKQ